MVPKRDLKFPPITPQQNHRPLISGLDAVNLLDQSGQKADRIQQSEKDKERQTGATAVVSVHPSASRRLRFSGSSHIYAGTGRKPELLTQLENYVNKELQSISPQEPKYQELKLQVYRVIFGCFIQEFKMYQPILSEIKKEYENTLAYQQDQIRELEPLRSHLRLVREECERKIQARWGEEQAEIGALKMEKQQLQLDIEAMRDNEKALQTVLEHMQHELSNQYLLFREEHDARKLLIGQLSDVTRASVKKELLAGENSAEAKDPVELQLALKVCRANLTTAQEELSKMKAEYWDVVPQRDWDKLQQTHHQTLLQLKTLQADFDQLKSEHDTLLELHKRGSMEVESIDSSSVQQFADTEEQVPLPALDHTDKNAELKSNMA